MYYMWRAPPPRFKETHYFETFPWRHNIRGIEDGRQGCGISRKIKIAII